MTTKQMRIQISDVYNTPTWRNKVDHMTDNQVIAIFHRFLKEDKFIKTKTAKIPGEKFHQMSLFECGMRGAYSHE